MSIDPGETSGICIAACNNPNDKTDWQIMEVSEMNRKQLYHALETKPLDLVIYEEYKLYKDKAKAMIGNHFLTVQYIGVIKYLCEKRGIPTLCSPTSNKAFWNNDRLKNMNLYVTSDHRRDAIRHFLHWLYFTSKQGNLKDLSPQKST